MKMESVNLIEKKVEVRKDRFRIEIFKMTVSCLKKGYEGKGRSKGS